MDFLSTRRLWEQNSAARAAFIEIELDLALTFCQLAATAVHAEKAQRNIEHARRALEMAGKFAERFEQTGRRLPSSLESKFKEVETLLGRLGGGFRPIRSERSPYRRTFRPPRWLGSPG